MTIVEIQQQLQAHGKHATRQQVHNYFRRFKIRPLGVLSRPRNYPNDSAKIIAQKIGIEWRSE